MNFEPAYESRLVRGSGIVRFERFEVRVVPKLGVELILRGGLLADYVEREDEIPVLRGRLLGDQQVLRRRSGAKRCRRSSRH